jgi:hypothetical protein
VRPKAIAAIIGLVAVVGGIGLLGYGISRIADTASYSECIGDDCLNDPWFLAFPGGILAMVFGLIIASWALSSIRSESSTMGPLRAFGFMTGLGAVFFALGSIFLISSNVAGDATDGTFVFLGVLFGLMGLIFIGIDLLRFRGELKKDRLRASGLKGTARVVGVSNTNVTINNSPMVNLDLEVTIPGQSPFRTRKRTVISPQSVGALMPGATLSVLADPARPTDIVLDWEAGTTPGIQEPNAIVQAMTGFAPAAFGGATGFGGLDDAMTSEILRGVSQALAKASGSPAPATQADTAQDVPAAAPASTAAAPASTDRLPARVSLETIQDTGVDVAGNRLYAFDLTVSVTGRQPYPVKYSAVVPKALVPRLMQGASFPADVDPAQPGQINIHWDR